MGSKILYNNNEYNGTIVNDVGVGEFTSNNGQKNLIGSNNERFNDYSNNTINNNSTYTTAMGWHNQVKNSCIATMVTGYTNEALDTSYSFISGRGNGVWYSNYSLVSGLANDISDDSCSIINGNRIKLNNSNINIINGDQLEINSPTMGVSYNIINGTNNSNNKLKASTLYYNLINGCNININGGNVSYNYINGYASTFSGNAYYSYINGNGNSISDITGSFINGLSNTFSNIHSSLIIGENNNVNYAQRSIIIGISNKFSRTNSFSINNLILGDYIYNEGEKNIIFGTAARFYGTQNLYSGSGNYPSSTSESDTYLVARKNSNRNSFLTTYYPAAIPRGGSGQASSAMGIIEGTNNICIGSGTVIKDISGNGDYNSLAGNLNVTIGSYNLVNGQANLVCSDNTNVEGSENVIAYSTSSESSYNDSGSTTYKNNLTQLSHIEGSQNKLLHGINTHVEGQGHKVVKSTYSHIEGQTHSAYNIQRAHIEGSIHTIENCEIIHVEGNQGSMQNCKIVHMEGNQGSMQNCQIVHMEGNQNNAANLYYSHIEGQSNIHSGGNYIHIEGQNNNGTNSSLLHIEGYHNTYTNSGYTHIEGYDNNISNCAYGHVEGKNNIAISTSYSHAEGWGAQIAGVGSHAQNLFTAASSKGQTSIGIANIPDMANTYALIVGNGSYATTSLSEYDAESTYNTDDEVIYNGKVYKCLEDGVTGTWDSTKWDLETTEIIDGQEITRSNALTLDWSGNLTTAGDVTANGVTLTNANPNISDAYDNTATYAVGNYCIYQNTLYKCTTAVATAEDFDSAKWTVTTIGSELLLLKSAIDALAAQLNGFTFNSLISQSDYDNLVATGAVDANTIYPIPES